MLGHHDRSLEGAAAMVVAVPVRWVVRRVRRLRRLLAGEPTTPQLGAREYGAPQLVDAA